MAKIKQLEAYTEAANAVAEFREKNSKIFAKFDALLLDQAEKETALKAYIKENIKDNIANDYFKVTYAPSYKKFYDATKVLALIKPKAKAALEKAGAISVNIDTTIFEDLVEKGEIPVEVKQEAFVEIEQAPRVSIKEAK